MRNLNLAFIFITLASFFSCKKNELTATEAAGNTFAQNNKTFIFENFETGTKTSYTSADVTLSTGIWTLNDAVLANSTSDKKTGAQSVRLRNAAKLTMKFNYASGASSVAISHAKYGSDGNSTWQLWYSTNNGSTYTQAGTSITTSTATLAVANFSINVSGNIRFEIRKTDGSANRLNLDDITITDFAGTTPPAPTTAKRFLFDASHGETAGNADWVIDEDNNIPQNIPTPLQSTITSSTGEGYWTGALSSWGIALAKLGHTVSTLPYNSTITYGNSTNAKDLSNYDVFVVDEPNVRFTTAEKTAILNFVNNGGGLILIADHTQSDRNNDGWDSPMIWNDLMANNPFGLTVDLTNFSSVSTNILSSASANPVLYGSQGNVTGLEFNNGTTFTLNTAANPNAKGLVWKSGATQNNTNVICASSFYGLGRVVAIGDSSPMDDGTGAATDVLYASWNLYGHKPLCMNASLWAAKLQ